MHGLLDDHVGGGVVGLVAELGHQPAQVVVAHDDHGLEEQHQEDVQREQPHLLGARDRQVLDFEDLLHEVAGAVAQHRDDHDAEDLQTEVPLEAVQDHPQVEALRRLPPGPLALVLLEVVVDLVGVVGVELVRLEPVHHVEVDTPGQAAVPDDRAHPAEQPPVQEAVRRAWLAVGQPVFEGLGLLVYVLGSRGGIFFGFGHFINLIVFVKLEERVVFRGL